MPKKDPDAVHRAIPANGKGRDAEIVQTFINKQLKHLNVDKQIAVDKQNGPETSTAAYEVAKAMGAGPNNLKALKAGRIPESAQRLIRGRPKTKAEKNATAHRKRYRIRLRKRYARTLQQRALDVAESMVGVMEQGGNNTGPIVDKIILSNGGYIGEPWCGDGMAFCYRTAGSKAVTRNWASVRLLSGVAGISYTSSPKPGDLVRFTFDHVGMFVKDNGDGTITTIEFNTGASGAVSDSSTGGDGVYKKIRSKSLVADYLHVSR